MQACQQYALAEFRENIVLLDTGHANLMSPFYPLDALREIPGFENVRCEDPYAGSLGNFIRFVGIAPRHDSLKIRGVENLFCAGEKAGLSVGHTQAIVTETLAADNAERFIKKEKLLVLPTALAVGDAIGYVGAQMQAEKDLGFKYTFSGSVYFDRRQSVDSTVLIQRRSRIESV